MRAPKKRAGASLVLAASLSLGAVAAHADELLVMPYACAMVGGRPLMTPAPEQSHRVIGSREQRTHTACSPANPDMCRNWTVHRFDLDCEGARVPWVAAVASVAEQRRRAWVEGGHLVLRMPPSWSFEPGDPCARPPSFDERFGFGRMRRYCADRRAMAPPPLVEMPFGFAPMLDIDGIFVRSSGPTAGLQPLPPLVAVSPPVASVPAPAPPKIARVESPPRAEPAPPPAARPEPRSEPVTAKDAPAHTPAPPKAAAKLLPQVPTPAAKPVPQATTPSAAPTGPIIPKIINRPETASTEVPEQMVTGTVVPKQEVPRPDAKVSAAPPVSKPPPQQLPPQAAAESSDAAITVNLLSMVGSPTAGLVALGGLALILLAAFALARRRERLADVRIHDIASVSLDGRRGHGQLVPRPSAQPRRPAAAAPSPTPPPVPQAAVEQREPAWAERIPQTRSEALQMLGMGVSPDATQAALKKVVDGLRQSWHPDLAKNETDRQVREFRLKQINAAWDLLQGKRLERLDS